MGIDRSIDRAVASTRSLPQLLDPSYLSALAIKCDPHQARAAMFCPYCGYDKEPEVFTDEHVVPKALGGGLEPENPLVLRVCGSCNAACGRWIDGPFVRSYLIHNARAQCGMEFCDPRAKPVVPLIYIGRMKAWSNRDEVCDFWLGPCGDHLYHFHRREPEHDTFVGRPPHVRLDDWDPGSVYIAFVTKDPTWHEIIYRSAQDAFKKAAVHFINAAPQGHAAPYPTVPPSRQAHVEFIRALPEGQMREHEMSMSIHAGTRFLAKLAIGFGSLFLAPEFAQSSQASVLRRFLWEKEPNLRDSIPVRGTGFLASDQNGNDLFAWRGCHTFVLEDCGDQIGLAVNFYGTQGAFIALSDDAAHWRDRLLEEGTALIVAPGLRRFAGPISLAAFVREKHWPSPNGPLAELTRRLALASRRGADSGALVSET